MHFVYIIVSVPHPGRCSVGRSNPTFIFSIWTSMRLRKSELGHRRNNTVTGQYAVGNLRRAKKKIFDDLD